MTTIEVFLCSCSKLIALYPVLINGWPMIVIYYGWHELVCCIDNSLTTSHMHAYYHHNAVLRVFNFTIQQNSKITLVQTCIVHDGKYIQIIPDMVAPVHTICVHWICSHCTNAGSTTRHVIRKMILYTHHSDVSFYICYIIVFRKGYCSRFKC